MRTRMMVSSTRQETVVELGNYREFVTTATVKPVEER
jgi:hypothetical protein